MLADARASGIGDVGVPHMGAGIGGPEWPEVRAVVDEAGEASAVMLTVVRRGR